MKWVDAFERLTHHGVIWVFLAPWPIFLLVFFLYPSACKPVGDNSRTYGEDCVKQANSLVQFRLVNKNNNENAATEEQEACRPIGHPNAH